MVKHCKKCDKEYSDSHKFCNECGDKLGQKEIHSAPKNVHSSNAKIWSFSIAGVILIIGLVIIFAIPFSYTATEEYTEKEAYMGSQQFTDTEQYTDKECDSVELTKNVKWSSTTSSCVDTDCTSYSQVCTETNWLGNCIQYQSVCQSSKCTRAKYYCSLTIKNLDNEGGTFGFDGYFMTTDDKEHFVESFSQYLQPDDEESFSWTYESDVYDAKNCFYENLETPSKNVCENVLKSREVTKTIPVTKYQDVSKTRQVTKYATLYNQWTGKVQWYYKV